MEYVHHMNTIFKTHKPKVTFKDRLGLMDRCPHTSCHVIYKYKYFFLADIITMA